MSRQIFILITIAIAGAVAVLVLSSKIREYEQNKQRFRLENAHGRAVAKFSESVDKFAYLMSGMRSYLKYSEEFPSQLELQQFFNYQINALGLEDSLIVSFINANHQFVYSFNRNQIDPGQLIGTSVGAIRDSIEMKRLNKLLTSEDIRLFPPINLVEGWVGIPIDFAVIRKEEPVGYVASVINFKNILEPVYLQEDSEELAFRFSVDGIYFDREAVHDNSKIYHSRKDPESFLNYNIPEKNWLKSNVTLYGQTFGIETAFIKESNENPYLAWLIGLFYLLLLSFGLWSVYRTSVYRRLSLKLERANQLLSQQKTELQDQYSELERLNNTKDRFFSIIGHDLRNPISSIINIVQLVESDQITADQTKEIMKQLGPAAKNTINLLENLLQWAMINNDDITFKSEKLNVNQLIDENLKLLEPHAHNKKISLLRGNFEADAIMGDANMISTVIRNLITNAIKFSEEGSEVRIEANRQNGFVTIDVIDQGVGLTEEEILDIRKLSLDSSRRGTAGERGTGLGLTLCMEFLKKHGGHLSIESKPNEGSKFSIYLPVAEP